MNRTYEFFLDESRKAEDVASLNDAFLNMLDKHGMDRMAFSLKSDHKEIGLKASIGIEHNINTGWMKDYHEGELIQIDPVQIMARHKTKIYKWLDVKSQMSLTNRQMKFLDSVAGANLHNGYFIPLWGHDSFAGMAVARSVRNDERPVDPDMLTALSRRYYESFINLHRKPKAEDTVDAQNNLMQLVSLSKRETEILQLTAHGKRDSDIAASLKVSPHTIDTHFRNIYRKLDVNTRAEAVAVVLSHHVIWM